MTKSGDQVRVSVSVALEPPLAFRVFTEESDQWWRRGPRFRGSGRNMGVLHLEPRVGGRLFETVDSDAGPQVLHTGTVTAWDPPSRLAFEWRSLNFAAGEVTQVEVGFEPTASGTLVTVTHRGWASIRPDHPARHGLDVVAFLRMMGLWWGELMTSLREHAGR